jgi:nucleotide-binding universal stress UspA family protein
MFQRVTVALDGSALGETVLPWVRQLLGEGSVKVWLVHAVAPEAEWVWGYAALGQPMPLPRPHAENYDSLARGYLDRVAASLAAGERVRPIVREGEPAAVIVRAAQETDAQLIAMSTHGRTGLGRLLLGSVADQVLRSSGRPVLLIRPDQAALQAAEQAHNAPDR